MNHNDEDEDDDKKNQELSCRKLYSRSHCDTLSCLLALAAVEMLNQ